MLMLRLHAALRTLGHDSVVHSRDAISGIPGAEQLDYLNGPLKRLRFRAGCSLENRLLRQPPQSYFSRLKSPACTPAAGATETDVVNLHWVSRWLDLPSFTASLPARVPLVWTVHDMSALAGGCFTDFGCDEFAKGCRVCPLLKFPFSRVLARNELRRRQKALAGRPVTFVANSLSTLSLVETSPLARGKTRKVIHPGFDFERFERIPKSEARAALGIPQTDFVLGFGAASLTYENKGADRFYKVAELVRKEIGKTSALIFGDGQPEESIPTRSLGCLRDDKQLALAYSAMDAHLVTSQMETFGQVSVEAQACGVPVFAFAVGGVPETLLDGKTGGLAPYAECSDMARQIVAAHREGRLHSMGQAGAVWVRNRFDSSVIAKQYAELYEEMLAPESFGRQS